MERLGKIIEMTTTPAINTGVDIMASAQQLLYEYVDYIANSIEVSTIYKEQYEKFAPLLKNKEADAVMIIVGTDSDYSVDKSLFEKRLHQEGVVFIGGDKERNVTISNIDGTEELKKGYVYFFDKADVKMVYQIRDEITNTPVLDHALKIERLSGIEASLIQQHMKEIGNHCEIYENRNNEYNVLYEKTDRSHMDSIKLISAIELSGQDGEKLKDQFEFHMNHMVKLEEKIYDKYQKEDFYVTDGSAVLKVTNKDVLLEDKNLTLRIDKSEENRGAICGCAYKMKQFIILDEKEYEEYKKLTTQEKNNYIKEELKNEKYPFMTTEEISLAYQKQDQLKDIARRIDPLVAIPNGARFSICETFDRVSGIKSVDVDATIEEASKMYFAIDDRDKVVALDPKIREELEYELTHEDYDKIMDKIDHAREEEKNMSIEDKMQRNMDLERMNADFNELWTMVGGSEK